MKHGIIVVHAELSGAVCTGRGDSTTRTGTGETAQGHRTTHRPARVIRGESTQASPGGDQ